MPRWLSIGYDVVRPGALDWLGQPPAPLSSWPTGLPSFRPGWSRFVLSQLCHECSSAALRSLGTCPASLPRLVACSPIEKSTFRLSVPRLPDAALPFQSPSQLARKTAFPASKGLSDRKVVYILTPRLPPLSGRFRLLELMWGPRCSPTWDESARFNQAPGPPRSRRKRPAPSPTGAVRGGGCLCPCPVSTCPSP